MTAVIRFIIHASMYIAYHLDKSRNGKLIQDLMQQKSVPKAVGQLFYRLEHDFNQIKSILKMGDGDACLTMHLILKQFDTGNAFATSHSIPNVPTRSSLETKISMHVNTILQSVRRRLDSLSSDLQESSRIATIRMVLEQPIWNAIHESQNAIASTVEAQKLQLFWRLRECVSFTHFVDAFNNVKNTRKLGLLSSFIKVESKLPIIKYTLDILAWHALLFEVFPANSLTREEAVIITNRQVIENHLQESRRKEGWEILNNYCTAFNNSFHQIERIFECEPNPFLSNSGEIDLSGGKRSVAEGGVQMSPDISINFSLPSLIQGANDTMGLCTIRLLELMQNAQGEIIDTLLKPPKAAEPLPQAVGGQSKILPKSEEQKDEKAEEAAAEEEENGKAPLPAAAVAKEEELFLQQVPSISYLTDSDLIKQQLIIYDRDTHLLPLLHIFSLQSFEYGEGFSLTYDLEKIQQSLFNIILSNKFAFKLQIRHFQYRGDIKNTGQLVNLHRCVKQEGLPPSILENIWVEIDTKDHFTRLMGQLEMCITFIVSVSGGGTDLSRKSSLDPYTPLQNYILNTLLIDPAIWSEITTQTISQSVRICHLQSLFLNLEEKMSGNPVDNIAQRYREELVASQEDNLKRAAKHLDLTILLPIFRNFIISQLTDPNWEPNENLKEYLTYAAGDFDLDSAPWYDHFPDTLTLAHAYRIYLLLSSLV